ncbi:MAG: hypothetical protein OXI63_24310 [Candidatus Poribacteria bacterium]|nr:hypothetical protein [Candidatus Poribacteria bacterium]
MNHARLLTDQAMALLNEVVIHVLLKNAHKNGRDTYMRPSDIGRGMGTYRRQSPSGDDPFGQIHHKLLRRLQNECRVEQLEGDGWRLTESEWKRLTLDEHHLTTD